MAFTPRLTILTFPQKLNGTTLSFNILIIPRNINPLVAGLGGGAPGAPPFATANLQLEAKVISGLGNFPSDLVSATVLPLSGIAVPASASSIFNTLAAQLNITNTTDMATPVNPNWYIKKYLPVSYRNAFNFTNPLSPGFGVTDDSYECAIKNGAANPAFTPSTNVVSWGQVFAYILRTPDIARAAGFIQSGTITITGDMFKNGGWLYVDVAPTGDYYAQAQAEKSLIKKYAARIPALTPNNNRNIFAAIQFPVLYKENPGDPDPVPPGNFDPIFIEASDYDMGFARIVHASQPISSNLLLETEDPDAPPRKDVGIRLGWDDEQLLIWQNRQMMEDPDQPGSGLRVDAPSGVSKYRVDTRIAVASGQTPNAWTSLSMVAPTNPLMLGSTPIPITQNPFELGTEVYPSRVDGNPNGNYWLPMYFAQWRGRSLALPDDEAAALFKTTQAGVTMPGTYTPVGLGNPGLYYGNVYDFRVRFADHTGGGPASTDAPDPANTGPVPVSTLHFKRYISPQPVLFPGLPISGNLFTGNVIKLNRPRLAYPAVVYANKYTDPIGLLTTDSDAAVSNIATKTPGRDFGLPDPDVDCVEITVEVKTLLMDNGLSSTGREAYVTLYQTKRFFPVLDFTSSNNPELDIPVTFVDANVLALGDPTNLLALGLNPGDIDSRKDVVLPTSRDIRITMTATNSNPDMNYFGTELSYSGLPVAFFARQESSVETNLFTGMGAANELQGIYLQPDANPVSVNLTTISTILLGNLNTNNPPDMVQRLASQVAVENKGFTLVGESGEHIQFGCAQAIRNSLSPDFANITFSTKADLLNQWIVVISLRLNRDWAWDALKTDSFLVQRIMKFSADGPITAADPYESVGYLRLGTSANDIALINPDRCKTNFIFFDAVEPKPLPGKFPDTIQLQYMITPRFVAAPTTDPPLVLPLLLPVTTNPAQVPVLASAGLALTPYQALNNYSATAPRERHLWFEFAEAPADPNDIYFIRLLNYAPDPLLCDLTPEMLTNTQEPALPIDPELIRVISSGDTTNDDAGLDAMQEMIPAETSNKHFLIPIPPGLNLTSNELFGMFTYEIRVGHSSKIWSTAQGRFGRQLRVTGVQHPAPGLFCIVNRDEKEIDVSAPHAVAVLNGINVTAKPPKTEIWALLYAQVMQTDGKSYRNILLDDRVLGPMQPIPVFKAPAVNKDGPLYSQCTWTNLEVDQMLAILGLPLDSSLSVLCVEMMPRPETYLSIPVKFAEAYGAHESAKPMIEYLKLDKLKVAAQGTAPVTTEIDPLSAGLGQFRILRTSPLTAVPFVCCTNC